MIKMLLARDSQFLIGKKDGFKGMPWHNREELKFFKETTVGHAVLMGRKTFQYLQSPLEGRRNIVLSRTANEMENVLFVQDIEPLVEYYKHSQDTLFVIGGKEVFELLFPYCDELIVSCIKGHHDGDVYYHYDISDFICTKIEKRDSFDVYYYQRRNT